MRKLINELEIKYKKSFILNTLHILIEYFPLLSGEHRRLD